MFVDVLLPGALTLYGANGTFHTALVAVSGELGDERDAQHMLRMARGDAAPCLHVERNTAAKHAVEWRPT